MVMFSGWQRTAPDTGIPSDLPMNGESTDLGVSPPDPAGYLGKVNERASLVESCPWCSAKGQVYGLRSYRINFHESITLCTNPECLFPLVSKPLEEVLSSLTAADCKDGGKRKGPSDEDAVACSKRHKAEDPEGGVGLATDAGLGDSGDASEQNASPNGNGERAEAPAHPAGEGSGRQADPGSRDLACGDLGHGALPLQNGSLGADGGGPDDGRGEAQPSGPLRVAGETGSENGDGTVPVSDRVSSVVEAARPTAEQIGLLLKEQVLTGGSKEPEASPTVEQEVRPTVEPEAVPEEQTARLAEEEKELPMEVHKVGLTEELNVGPAAEAEARPMVEPGAIPVEQAARLAAELKVGPTVEEEVRPTMEEVRPTVEEEVRPTVEQEDGPAEMVAVPSHLFWRNENNLCWLDTLLVALVHCRTLRKRAASLLKNNSPVQQLCNRYREACDHVKAQEQMGHEDKIVKVPSAVLNQTVKELEDVRMSAFKLLQPKLKLNLGQEETPVFALPALLRLDSSVETLFQHIFHWDFECAVCGHTSRSRCQKTLSTFTGVFPDWHPLRAVHQAQCNNCERKLQKRKMVLKSISPVFALHFVEGLPQNDVDAYSFDFHGNHYSVSTVIQYDQHLKHFVAWIRDDSGSWLEFDDLKYPQCTSHKRLPVPASQIHMVFWEDGAPKPEGACLAGGHQGDAAPEAGAGAGDLSLTFPQDDTYIVEALTQGGTSPDRPDSSVGSSTLLEAFEGLSHSDIVTLTLVEVKADADGGAPPDGQPPPVAAETSPVSSTRAAGGKGCQTTKPQRGARGARRAPGGGTPVPQDRGPAGPPSTATPIRWPFPIPDPSSPGSDPPSPVSKPPSPSAFPASRMSAVLSKHPLFQSTPAPPKRAVAAPAYKPALKLATDDGLPDRVAATFSGFQARGVAAPTNGPLCRTDDSRPENEAFKQPGQKPPSAGNPALASLKPARGTEAPPQTTLLRPARDPKTKISPLDDTGALRRKLMRKLKKKKQLLAALDSMMGKEALDSLQRPDSTAVGSPYAVSSTTSQCSSAGYDELLNDLLSPATTASNLSPDSTGLLEMLVTAQEGVENPPTAAATAAAATARPGGGGTADWAVPAATGNDLASAKDDFLDELMSGTGFQTSHAENVDFNMLDMFF
ncbi:SUMO-specific isopeptidase USPL1 [Anguilla rostrata]|uniref:SUMO-specific isopeptidase USPL1 n=1 Tax=Anguilla rostrata TaxID=7938 RepID=UPI0030CDED9F